MRFMVWLCQAKYRWLANGLLYPITAYFLLTSGSGRQASKRFFINVKGRYTWQDHYQQLLCFANSLLDRVSILLGRGDDFDVCSVGRKALLEAREKQQGLILLGSHLGNFEASKLLAKDRANLDVHIVAYFGGSQKVRKQLDAIDPEMVNNIIDPTAPDAVFRMRDVVDRGGILAILGDRVGLGENMLPVEFLGEQAYLPAGPYFLASILKCPVYCFFGLRAGPLHYHTYNIKLADKIELNRKQRKEDAIVYAQAYADLLAEKAREYPYNWFNFFDFWKTTEGSNQ